MVYILNRPLFQRFKKSSRDKKQQPILYLKTILFIAWQLIFLSCHEFGKYFNSKLVYFV